MKLWHNFVIAGVPNCGSQNVRKALERARFLLDDHDHEAVDGSGEIKFFPVSSRTVHSVE